jgi:mono/diheme cytochrome c family protein
MTSTEHQTATSRKSRSGMAKRGAVAIILLALAAAVSMTQGQQTQKPSDNSRPAAVTASPAPLNPHYAITDEDIARKNRVKFTDVSVTRGKKLFVSQCSMCHGVTADGKGDLAKEMDVVLPDFTKPETLKKRTDGELFKILNLGNVIMPGQDKRMSETHRWQIINFLRAAAGAVPEKATGKEASDEGCVEVPK